MIATSLILGATLLIGFGLVIKFWNKIISYLKKLILKVQESIHTAVLGVRVFLRKTSDGIMQITKNYTQDQETKKWTERIVRKPVNEDEIPKDKRDRLVMEEEFDISDELESKLSH